MLHVDKVDSLIGENVRITVNGLEEWKCYKIRMELAHSTGTHASYGVFYSDGHGTIDLERDKPIRGTYHGINGMGLFLSITPTSNVRFGSSIRENEGRPWFYNLQLIDRDGVVLNSVNLKKRFIHPLVERVIINENGLHGILYKPPGVGPFPCVIDVPGANGTFLEYYPTSLATQGFLVFTFVYFGAFPDLPKSSNQQDAEFFQKPIDYVLSLPECNGKIGLYGNSFGGVLANFMATRSTKISAVVAVNFYDSFSRDEMVIMENGKPIECEEVDKTRNIELNGLLIVGPPFKKLFSNIKKEHKLKWENVSKNTVFRLIGSMDDLVANSIQSVTHVAKDLKDSGHSVEVDIVPTGHSIGPIYYPHIDFSYNKFYKKFWGMGGECWLQAVHQANLWTKNVEFFKKHLGKTADLSDWKREDVVIPPIEKIKSRL